MKEIDDEKVDGLAEQPKNNDINNIADAQEKRKKELEEHGKALKAQREKNMRDVIIDYSDYKELETEDQLLTAFDSQPTIEDKFFIYANLASRNHLIGESINLLTEKERVNLGMYPRVFEDAYKTVSTTSIMSYEQTRLNHKAHYNLMEDIRYEFFSKNDKKHMSVEGCRRFMEMLGKVTVKPYVELGRQYDDVRNSLPKEGNTARDLDYKTNYILQKAFVKESTFANQAMMTGEDIENVFHSDKPAIDDGEFHSRVHIGKYINSEIKKHMNDNIEAFMDYMQITDKEERISLLDTFKSDKKCTVSECLDNLMKDGKKNLGYAQSALESKIKEAWKNQGTKMVLGTLTDKDQVAWKRGVIALDTRGNYKYKKWIQDYGDPLSTKMYRKNFESTFKGFNKKIVSTKPAGPGFSDKTQPVSFVSIEKKLAASNKTFKVVEVDAEREAAKGKYDAYIAAHTGANRITQNHEKNVEVLSKAMAASIVKDSPDTRTYSVKMIHNLAEKLTVSLKLGEMAPEKVSEILSDPKNIGKAIKDRSKALYYPTEENQNQKNYVNSLDNIGKVMMRSYDRSPEYKAMVKYVKNIGSLESYYLKTPEGKDELIENGVNLFQATETYMKGKKSVRSTNDGKERFDNALDVLAVIHKYLPEMRGRVEEVVARINKVRGAEAANHKDHVDLKNYGPERAQRAELERMKRDSGAKEKDLKNIRPAQI